MKLFAAILSLACLSALVSCGDEGIGFDIGKEVPVSIPVDIPQGDPRLISLDLNPPPISYTETYSLDDVTSNSDDLDNLDEVVVNGVSYEILNVSTEEEVGLEAFTMNFSTSSGQAIGTVTLTTSTLQNVSKTSADFDYQALTSALQNKETIEAEIVVDFSEVPPVDINFDFNFYFDVVLKIRQ